jgi:hypothetical protein
MAAPARDKARTPSGARDARRRGRPEGRRRKMRAIFPGLFPRPLWISSFNN